MRRVYLDHNATAPLRPEARAALLEAMDAGGNPSSTHAEGREARRIVDDARERIAAQFQVNPSQVVFTSGATEAANWLASPFGYTRNNKSAFLSAVEHVCVLQGHSFHAGDVSEIGVDSRGLLKLDDLRGGLAETDNNALVAVQLANNETGVIQPAGEIAAASRAHGAFLVSDAVQAPGRLPLDELAAVDAFFLSAHKFGGPKGAGAAIIQNDAFQPQPQMQGGGQEFRKRAGTENVIGIAGMAAALDAALRDEAEFTGRALDWQRRLEDGIRDIAPDAMIFGEGAPRLPNTTCFAVPGLDAETALIALDLGGVAVSSGSACSSGRIEPSHVLAAMGVPADMARGAIRVSTGWTTRDADIDCFLAAFARLAGNRRRPAAA